MTAHEIEQELRTEYWLNHGCGLFALYGDDGEMQCGMCLLDFKRMDLAVLKEHTHLGRRAKTVVRKMDWSGE